MKGMDQQLLDQFIDQALYEDIQTGDHTSQACIEPNDRSKAKLLVKDTGVLAGVAFAQRVFAKVDPSSKLTVEIEDGKDIKHGDIAFYVECNSQALLKAERLILNTMQRLSGVATLASRFAVEIEGLPVKILDTRKTTPLMRFLEKWAVRVGGCNNYRDGLYDWIMIKDNHIDACGGIQEAIKEVYAYQEKNNLSLGVTVEVRNLVELHKVLEVGNISRIMLDNFELPLLREAVATIDGRFESEASGGVTLSTVRKIAETGVNFISVGALTHSSGTLDMSLKVIKEN